jgi:hypothetical protein
MSETILGSSYVRFTVDKVETASHVFWCEPLLQHIPKRFRRKLLVAAEPRRPLINPYAERIRKNLREGSSQFDSILSELAETTCGTDHPLIDAVHMAFASHYPLQLSPDIIWLVIAQGFGQHVSENAESLRGRIVRHQGKMELRADLEEFSAEGLASMVQMFSQQIQDHSDPVLHENLLCDFSTTTPIVRTASEVVLMDSLGEYFEYSASSVCGIPAITLSGTIGDWERIRARVEVLATYGLEWWVSRLRPILDEFIETAKGRPNRNFWQAIYKPTEEYFQELATGWIADLFPYLGDPPRRRRNGVFESKRSGWLLVSEAMDGTLRPSLGYSPRTKDFPSGLCSVPVTLTRTGHFECKVELIAGFVGVEQLPDLALAPVISWALAEPGVTKPRKG